MAILVGNWFGKEKQGRVVQVGTAWCSQGLVVFLVMVEVMGPPHWLQSLRQGAGMRSGEKENLQGLVLMSGLMNQIKNRSLSRSCKIRCLSRSLSTSLGRSLSKNLSMRLSRKGTICLCRWIKENVPEWSHAVVASPDEGGTRRAGGAGQELEQEQAQEQEQEKGVGI